LTFSLSLCLRPSHSFPTRRSSDLNLATVPAYFGAPVSDGALDTSRTFWPARTRSAPSTITRSPGLSPSAIIQREPTRASTFTVRSEEHTSELQSPDHLVCRLRLEK